MPSSSNAPASAYPATFRRAEWLDFLRSQGITDEQIKLLRFFEGTPDGIRFTFHRRGSSGTLAFGPGNSPAIETVEVPFERPEGTPGVDQS